jgi:hypothetical protein
VVLAKDQDFADRIHTDLQNKGVRCWFAPHDMPIGGKILDEIDDAIRLRDKVLLILSEHSIRSDWFLPASNITTCRRNLPLPSMYYRRARRPRRRRSSLNRVRDW